MNSKFGLATVAVVLVAACFAGLVGAQCIDYGDYLHSVSSIYMPYYPLGVTISGNHAYVACTESGVCSIDISNPLSPQIDGVVNAPGYERYLVASGTHAYVTCSTGLQVIDISNPQNPQFVSGIDMPEGARGIAISGTYAYTVTEYIGLHVIDIINPESPQIVGSLNLPGWAGDVAISGNYAYVAGGEFGLQVIDVMNPQSLQVVSNVIPQEVIFGIAISGDYAYVTGYDGFQAIDISNPQSPQVEGFVDYPCTQGFVVVQNSYAYVHMSIGLQVIDISNPHNLRIVGSINTLFDSFGIAVTNSHAIVVGQTVELTGANSIDVSSNNTDTPFMDSGLQVIDIANPQSPQIVGSIDTPGAASSVIVEGDYAYVAQNESGLQVINIIDPMNLQIAGSADTPGSVCSVAVSGEYAYVADGESGLQVFNISNPMIPQVVGSVDTPGFALGVAVSAPHAFVADGESGLQIISVTDPYNLQIVGSMNPPEFGYAYDVVVTGNYAYVAYGSCLHVIDISNPENPQFTCSVNARGEDLAILGTNIFLADTFSGLQVIDISNPASPQIVGSARTVGFTNDVAISGIYAYVSYEFYDGSGYQVVDISNPAYPQITGSVNTPNYAEGVAVLGAYVYVACGAAGLQVLPAQCVTDVPNLLTSFTVNVDGSSQGYPILPGLHGAPLHLQRTVNLSWSLSESIAPEFLRLTSSAGGATWDVPFAPDSACTDGWGYAAIDQAPQLATVLQARYTLLHAVSPGTWTSLAERMVSFSSHGTPEALVPSLHVYPNPFNPLTQVSYMLVWPGSAQVAVYSLTGSLVKVLADGPQAAGPHSVTWDGRDANSRDVPAGAYVVRIVTETGMNAVKSMLVR